MTKAREQRRPTRYDCAKVIEMVADTKSLRGACEELGLHCPSTHTMIDEDAELRGKYARAREVRGESFGEQVASIATDVLAKRVPPEVGRVAMDGLKWTSARMAPKRWGDRLALEHSGQIGLVGAGVSGLLAAVKHGVGDSEETASPEA